MVFFSVVEMLKFRFSIFEFSNPSVIVWLNDLSFSSPNGNSAVKAFHTKERFILWIRQLNVFTVTYEITFDMNPIFANIAT